MHSKRRAISDEENTKKKYSKYDSPASPPVDDEGEPSCSLKKKKKYHASKYDLPTTSEATTRFVEHENQFKGEITSSDDDDLEEGEEKEEVPAAATTTTTPRAVVAAAAAAIDDTDDDSSEDESDKVWKAKKVKRTTGGLEIKVGSLSGKKESKTFKMSSDLKYWKLIEYQNKNNKMISGKVLKYNGPEEEEYPPFNHIFFVIKNSTIVHSDKTNRIYFSAKRDEKSQIGKIVDFYSDIGNKLNKTSSSEIKGYINFNFSDIVDKNKKPLEDFEDFQMYIEEAVSLVAIYNFDFLTTSTRDTGKSLFCKPKIAWGKIAKYKMVIPDELDNSDD